MLATQTLVTAFIISFFASWSLYGTSRVLTQLVLGVTYKRWPRDEKAAWDTRFVSCFHSVVVFVGAAWAMYTFDYTNREAMVYSTDSLMQLVLACSLGYFVQDLIVILYERGVLWVIPDVVHHCVCILQIVLCFYNGSFYFYTMWALLGELSTPILNIRWMNEKLQSKSTLIDALFLMSFFVSRPISYILMIWSAIANYHYWSMSTIVHIQLTFGVLMTLLNLYWSTLILRALAELLFPDKSPKAAKAA